MTKTDKEIMVDILQKQVDNIRTVKGSAMAKMAAEELQILVERFRRGELTLEQLREPWLKIANEYVTAGLQTVKGMADDLNKGWRRR